MTATANDSPPLPPGPKGHGFQNMRRLAGDLDGFMASLHADYGDIACYEVPGARLCAVFSAELMKEVLVDKEPVLPPAYPRMHFDIVRSRSLARWRGADHRRLTGLVASAFSEERMGVYARMLAGQAATLAERLRPGRTVDFIDEAERLSWKAMLTALFGDDRDIDHRLGRPMIKSVKLAFIVEALPASSLIERLPLPFVRRAHQAARELDGLAYDAIRRARDPNHPGEDVVSHLVRASENGLADWTYDSDEDIRDEAFALLFAGYESPATGLVSAQHYLARNPVARDRLEREADGVLNGRPVEADDYASLPFAQAVCLETLRLRPSGGLLVAREALEDTTLSGYSIPKGTRVQIPTRLLHRRADYWEAPDEFRPERWLTEPHEGRGHCPSHPYVGFSKAPRYCRGTDYAMAFMTFALATVARRFRLEPVEEGLPAPANTEFGSFGGPFPVTVHERDEGPA